MKNKLFKLFGVTIVACFFVFNMLYSSSFEKYPTSILAHITTTNVNAEDWSTCYWSPYGGGDYGPFMFCGYEVRYQTCTCGDFIPH